jgi:uncharacterized membrane protein
MVEQMIGTFAGRWYVTIFGLVFLMVAGRHLGAKGTAAYTAIAVAVGVVAENGSVLVGIPYTTYTFNPALRGKELWIFDVPLMVPLSYTFLAYFAFATARLVVSGPYTSRGRQPVLEYLLAVTLATWALWIIDPVSRLGRYHMVGELFHYAGPGFWFGLPLGSQVGFFCTSGILIGVLTVMMRNEPRHPVPRLLRHPRLPAMLTYLGEVIFMTVTAAVVALKENAEIASTADSLVGAAMIIYIPMFLVVAVYWRSLPQAGSSVAPAPTPTAHELGHQQRNS